MLDNEPDSGLLPWPWYVAYCGDIDMASFQKPVRKTYRGRALAILRPRDKAGVMTLTAEAEELAPAVASVATVMPSNRTSLVPGIGAFTPLP